MAAESQQSTGSSDELEDLVSLLENNQQFQQLSQQVQQNPEMVEAKFQEFSESNPQLAQLINQKKGTVCALLLGAIEDDTELPPGARDKKVFTAEDEAALKRVSKAK